MRKFLSSLLVTGNVSRPNFYVRNGLDALTADSRQTSSFFALEQTIFNFETVPAARNENISMQLDQQRGRFSGLLSVQWKRVS